MKKSNISKRAGGNGGYSKKKAVRDIPGAKRKFNLRSYDGKKVKK